MIYELKYLSPTEKKKKMLRLKKGHGGSSAMADLHNIAIEGK